MTEGASSILPRAMSALKLLRLQESFCCQNTSKFVVKFGCKWSWGERLQHMYVQSICIDSSASYTQRYF